MRFKIAGQDEPEELVVRVELFHGPDGALCLRMNERHHVFLTRGNGAAIGIETRIGAILREIRRGEDAT